MSATGTVTIGSTTITSDYRRLTRCHCTQHGVFYVYEGEALQCRNADCVVPDPAAVALLLDAVQRRAMLEVHGDAVSVGGTPERWVSGQADIVRALAAAGCVTEPSLIETQPTTRTCGRITDFGERVLAVLRETECLATRDRGLLVCTRGLGHEGLHRSLHVEWS